MANQTLKYHSDDIECVSLLYRCENADAGTIMLVPAFDGMTNFIKSYAQQVVAAGYHAMVVDMYGDGIALDSFDESVKHFHLLFNDRSKARTRILDAFKQLCQQDAINSDKIAIMGFCAGGMYALDLARAGADVKAAVCLHGVLAAPEGLPMHDISAKILILHGYDDFSIPPENLHVIAKEMNDKNVDWQFVFFGHTKHSFTEPGSENFGPKDGPRQYNADSARRAWTYCQDLFAEVLA